MNGKTTNKSLRGLPSVGRLLERPDVAAAIGELPHQLVADSLRAEIAAARQDLAAGAVEPHQDTLVERALTRARRLQSPSLRRAINATGIVLHTGLGRAVLPDDARKAVQEVASGHSTLEVDAETGRRGSRREHVAGLLCELSGAEAAAAVNNNAGAVLLAVATLAAGREVVISRGELVEIGGSFRMPDIIRAGGATLVEVGTTNRTRLSDFAEAINENTALLLRCHPSNFRMVGFTADVSIGELAELAHQRGVLVVDDLGSGALIDPAELGVGPALTLRQSAAVGCDVVTASGDKLLGGPQAGLIVGRAQFVDRMAAHPLARALRLDKMSLAALEATLKLYRDPERARAEIPTLRYLSRTHADLRILAERLRASIVDLAPRGSLACGDLIEERSQVGAGSLPGEDLPTVCVRIQAAGVSDEVLAARLRCSDPPVFARIREGAVLLDPRTLEEAEIGVVAGAVARALAGGPGGEGGAQ